MCISAHFFFNKFTKRLVELYPELFEDGGATNQHQINFGRKWKSYSSLIQLSGNNIDKMDEVVKEPLEKCLLWLAYQSDKVELEDLMHKDAMKKIR